MELLSLLNNSYITRSPLTVEFFEDEGLLLKVNFALNRENTLIENTLIFEVTGLYFPLSHASFPL